MNATSTRPTAVRRLGSIVAVVAAAATVASCATGQIAETANVVPSIDGTFGQVGPLKLEGVALQTPFVPGRSTGTQFYVAGDYAPMRISIVNTAHSSDTLKQVSSTAFTGWNIVRTSTVTALPSAGSAPPVTSPPQPASTPSGSAAAPSGLTGAGNPAKIMPASSLPLGLQDLGTIDPATGLATSSKRTLVLTGLRSGKLYPGESVKVTFTFAKAGPITLTVPVAIGDNGSRETVPAPPTPTAGA